MILAADLHLTLSPPLRRVDDFWATQERKVEWLLGLAGAELDKTLAVAGDLFDKPFATWLAGWFGAKLIKHGVRLLAIPGQHDMPFHRPELLHKSGFGVLLAHDLLVKAGGPYPVEHSGWCVYGAGYGDEVPEVQTGDEYPRMLLWHCMVVEDEPLWPGQEALRAADVLALYPDFDLILCGDNHKHFMLADQSGRVCLNPGSLMRTKSDQVGHRPRVGRVDEPLGRIELVDVPIEPAESVFDLSQIQEEKERDTRISEFAEKLGEQCQVDGCDHDDYGAGLKVEDNVTKFLEANPQPQRVEELIWESLQYEQEGGRK
jgi:DNA repair exonuclease SbcCD nuclease subunit